jgi:hypothetical protein
MDPRNALEAAAHIDPYPYYERLLAGPPLHYDSELERTKVAAWTREFVACVSPLSTSAQLAAASNAANPTP